MPNIDDLKTDKSKFTPSITQGPSTYNNENSIQPSVKRPSSKVTGMGVVQGETTTTIYPQGTVKTIINKNNPNAKPQQQEVVAHKVIRNKEKPEQRMPADFSAIPQVNQEFEDAGIEKRESIIQDVFGAGGPFDKWKEEKTKEYNEYMQKIEEEEVLAAFENGTENKQDQQQVTDDTDKDLEDEYETIPPVTSYRQINIVQQEENNKMVEEPIKEENNEFEFGDYGNYEEDIADDIEEESNEEATSEEVVTEEIQYAAPEPGVSVDAYDNATEVVSVTEEQKEIPVENNLTRSVINVDIEADEDENSVSVTSETDEQDQENEKILKALIREKIAPVSKKLDLSSFTVVKKATNSNNIFQTTQAAVAKWVLPSTGVTVSMREMSGADLEKLRELMVDNSVSPNFREGLRIIYDHIVSPKPQSYEKWLKTTASADFEHLFMAVHIASFGEANYIPIDCVNPTCKKPYLTNNIKIMDMVKFTDDESKAKFWNLYNSEATESEGLYTTEIVPMSNQFAIGFKEPSLYDIYVESTYYSGQFQEKYSSTMNYLPYIDSLYVIDQTNRALIPIGYTTYDNNLSKTFRSKVMKYDKVLGTLTSDQHAILGSYASKVAQRINWFTYQIPETTCIHCGHVHPAIEDQTPSSMVFLRNRLTLLATT